MRGSTRCLLLPALLHFDYFIFFPHRRRRQRATCFLASGNAQRPRRSASKQVILPLAAAAHGMEAFIFKLHAGYKGANAVPPACTVQAPICWLHRNPT
jgi:hypothetical protein